MKGFLIIAVGNGYYAQMAYNLAVSLKCESKVNVCLAHDSCINHLDDYKKFVFTDFVEVDSGGQHFGVKLKAQDISPYDETILIDADTIRTPYKNPVKLFDENKGKDFQCVVFGHDNLSRNWVNNDEVKKMYGFETLTDISSEFIYFTKKTKVFEKAQKYWNDPRLMPVNLGGCKPDEPYLMCAIADENLDLPVYRPTWWESIPKEHWLKEQDIYHNYSFISMGGSNISKRVMGYYDNLAKYYFKKIGYGVPFPYINKQDYLKLRKAI